MDIKDTIEKTDLGEPYNALNEFTLSEIFSIEKILQGRQIKFRKNNLNIHIEFAELINLIGLEKVKRLIHIFSGENIYFPEIKKACKKKIKALILSDFNGYNILELSRKYGYTERHMRRIVNSKGNDKNLIENQLSIFDK